MNFGDINEQMIYSITAFNHIMARSVYLGNDHTIKSLPVDDAILQSRRITHRVRPFLGYIDAPMSTDIGESPGLCTSMACQVILR